MADRIAMKFLLILIMLLAGLGLGLGKLFYLPKNTYYEVVSKAKYTEYYSLPVSPKMFLVPGRSAGSSSMKKIKDFEGPKDWNHSNFWKNFIIQNYIIPIPIRHAEFYFVPVANAVDEISRPQLGFAIYTQNDQKILEILFHRPIEFKRNFKSQKLYQIPLFFEYLKEKRPIEIWEDMFSFDLTQPSEDIQKMAYQLYLLEQRVRYFPKNMKKFSFINDIGRGLVELENPEMNTEKHNVYHYFQGMMYHFSIEVFDVDPEFVEIRNRLVREIRYQEFTDEVSRVIYNEFKSLPYRRQISQEGMIYLFSAWSLNIDNRNFLREMIRYLERGKDNLPQLGPLYDYALTRYHSSFSKRDEKLREDAEEKLKRKEEEERQAQRLKEATRPVDLNDQNFNSDEEKIDFFLQKAKNAELEQSENSNLDESSDILEMD